MQVKDLEIGARFRLVEDIEQGQDIVYTKTRCPNFWSLWIASEAVDQGGEQWSVPDHLEVFEKLSSGPVADLYKFNAAMA